MATTEVMSGSHAHRRRPFSSWMKKLANFKSSDDKRQNKKKRGSKANNPYPESGHIGNGRPHEETPADSFATAPNASQPSRIDETAHDASEPAEPEPARTAGTASTDHEAANSAAPSHGASSLAGTNRTVGGGLESRRGGDSTFSSPAPSVRSLTTTLTTIQSVSPNGANGSSGQGQNQSNAQSIQFSQPFPPTTTSPASAIPAHLAPTGVPNTYTAATANGLLTDNASILTLASSSKRRRRRSMDTDASVRAMAPSSVWGGSRESLPLSVLSANMESSGMPNTPGLTSSNSRIGAERNSIYSSTGVPPAVSGDRNSYYAKQNDAASVRSGRPGHARTESMGNTGPNSPLVGVPTEKGDKTEKEDALAPPPTKEE